jgi:septal ring factor EnvC (AmiA/AmiB activator)
MNRRRWQIAAGAGMLLLLVVASRGFVGDLVATSQGLAEDRQERDVLAAEVERLRTDLAVEMATRTELEQQAAELTAQVAELNRQVEFLAARRAPVKNTD